MLIKIQENKIKTSIILILKTLFLGMIGGVIFNIFLLPLPWVLGPAFIVALMALFKVELNIPSKFRYPFIGIIGVWLGTCFNQSLIENLDTWLISLFLLMIYVPIAYFLTFLFLIKVRKINIPEAFFIASPGGLLEMVLGAESCGADSKQVGIIHMIRIFLTVFIVPFLILSLFPGSFVREPFWPNLEIEIFDCLILLIIVPLGLKLGTLLQIPGPRLFGPLILSGIISVFEIYELNIPILIFIIAQLIVGSFFGSNFNGLSWTIAKKYIGHAACIVMCLLVILIPFLFLTKLIGDISPEAIILAFSPGGVNEMGLVASVLDIEPAFVVTHHLLRLTVVIIILVFSQKYIYPEIKKLVKPKS